MSALKRALNEVTRIEPTEIGITCQACNSNDISVVDSRESKALGSGSIRRRRKCNNCTYKWRTYEISLATIKNMQKTIDELLKVRT